jgi:hypothetical protein
MIPRQWACHQVPDDPEAEQGDLFLLLVVHRHHLRDAANCATVAPKDSPEYKNTASTISRKPTEANTRLNQKLIFD